jgi:predicted dehydrogenase
MGSSKPVRIGIAGLGRAGWGMHCTELEGKEKQFQVVAGCDPIAKKRTALKRRYGCAVYRDIGDLLADPEVELVNIATRSCDHLAHTASALNADKDVCLEKPICVNYAESKKLVSLAEKSKGNVYVRHNRRFDPEFLHIQEIMASGVLGKVFEIRLTRYGYQRRDDWQTFKKFGGGQLLNWGPHIVDHALRFLEAPVESVWSNLKRVAAAGDAEDHIKIILKGTNGRVAELEISGGAAVRDHPQYLILGTKGSLSANGEQINLRYLNPKIRLSSRRASTGDPGTTFGTKETLPWIDKTIPVKPRKTYDIWNEMYKAIRRGTKYPITLEESLEVMRIISLAKKGTGF